MAVPEAEWDSPYKGIRDSLRTRILNYATPCGRLSAASRCGRGRQVARLKALWIFVLISFGR